MLGNYATKRNVNLGIQVQKSNNGKSAYNINFSVNGKYVNISQFITDIENSNSEAIVLGKISYSIAKEY